MALYLKKCVALRLMGGLKRLFQLYECALSPIVSPSLGFLCTHIVFIIDPPHFLFLILEGEEEKDSHHYPSLWQLDLARLPYAFFVFPSPLVCMIFFTSPAVIHICLSENVLSRLA